MQETRLVDPFLFVNDDAMHQRDLPGRSAEIDATDLQPDQKSFAEARPGIRLSARYLRHAALAGQLCRSSAAKRSHAKRASYTMNPRCSSPWSSSPAKAERPSETACRPAASAAISGRAVSAPRTIRASRASEGSPSRPNS